jgi:hypothetical protein
MMNPRTFQTAEETVVRALYKQLWDSCNKRNAADFAATNAIQRLVAVKSDGQ